MDPMSGFDIRLVFTLLPRDVHYSTKDSHTSELTFLALQPWAELPCIEINHLRNEVKGSVRECESFLTIFS